MRHVQLSHGSLQSSPAEYLRKFFQRSTAFFLVFFGPGGCIRVLEHKVLACLHKSCLGWWLRSGVSCWSPSDLVLCPEFVLFLFEVVHLVPYLLPLVVLLSRDSQSWEFVFFPPITQILICSEPLLFLLMQRLGWIILVSSFLQSYTHCAVTCLIGCTSCTYLWVASLMIS